MNINKTPTHLIKYQIERDFHEWIEGLPDYTLFEKPIKDDEKFFINLIKKENKKIHENQVIFKD